MRYYLGILFFCLILVSCDRSAYEEIIFSGDVETRKHISENIFYGINPDPNYYIDNDEYNVTERNIWEAPEFDRNQNPYYYFTAFNDDITIEFVNNILETVGIWNNTNEYILGKYIGKNIEEINNILGKANYNYGNFYLYSNFNENNGCIEIITYTDGDIYYIVIRADNKINKELLGLNVDE
ncbi:MAG: hypothetical protein LBI28_11190 [Treponema sp.]|jgi:hypothetical protein|nr:hypothetical protein [Treponema sp.]